MDICSSPWLFAAYHVFLRLLVPRHPPCALSSLTSLAQCIALHRLVVFLFLVFSDVLIKIFLSFSRFIQYAVFKVRSCAFLYSHLRIGRHSGDGEIRTLDPLLARQVLSQLSYTPTDAGLPSFEAIPFLILFFRLSQADGLKWTRTTDLTLIRRAL